MLWRWLVVVVLLPLCWPADRVWACYAVIVGREASADGSVLVGHNEQNGGRRILNFRKIPRQQFPEGALVRLHGGGEMPDVPETWAFLWSENPGLEFSDGYLNEWGVAVVSDGCHTREDTYEALSARGEIRDGGIGYMLRRLVAQRARSAREGVRLAGMLVERFGYVHSGRTYVIADAGEAWLLAVVRGRRWVARRVPDDAVVLLPNVHIIGPVDLADTDNYLASPDLIQYAVARGWFDPNGGKPFSFREAYGVAPSVPPDPRRLRGRQLVMGRSEPEPADRPLAFGVRPARKMTVASVIEILRDKVGTRSLSTPLTQEGAVFQLRADLPRPIGCIYWRTTAEPWTSVLVPWYLGVTETPTRYFRPVDVQTQLSLAHHFEPPEGTFDVDPDLAWWKFKTLQDLVYADESRGPVVRFRWAAFERRVFREQPAVEAKALELWRTDRTAARRFLTRHCAALADEACREADELIEGFGEKGLTE
jgi:dipeptidase